MKTLQKITGIVWRSLLVGVGYVAVLLIAGIVFNLFGVQMSNAPGSESILLWVLISSIVMAFFLGPLAAQMHASRWRHILVWSSVIFLNLGSVAIEGAIFAPELVPMPLTVLFALQLLGSLTAAFLVTRLFAVPGTSTSLATALRTRSVYRWLWRFVVASLGYLTFYYLFGAINYELVTGPYYTSHAGGLTVPPRFLVLLTESVRAPLIVLSVGLFIFSFQATRKRAMLTTGLLLFWIGGLVPILLQVNSLPTVLLAASAVEIFFQNFLTGLFAAWLLWAPLSKG